MQHEQGRVSPDKDNNMRCLSCDTILTDQEATRKYASSGTFIDLCNKCFSTIADDIPDLESETIADEFSTEDVDSAIRDYERATFGGSYGS